MSIGRIRFVSLLSLLEIRDQGRFNLNFVLQVHVTFGAVQLRLDHDKKGLNLVDLVLVFVTLSGTTISKPSPQSGNPIVHGGLC